MANSKISALTSATTPLAGTETLPVVQSGTTKQVSVANLTAGRDVAGLSFTGGNVKISGNTVTTTDTNGNLTLDPNGSGYTIIAAPTNGTIAQMGNLSSRTFYLKQSNFGGYDNDTLINESDSGVGQFQWKNSGATLWTMNYTGNLVQGTANKGINFTANTPASGNTSQLLNDYQEGTWTPSFVNGTFGYSFRSGFYTKVGRLVTISGLIVWSSKSGAGDLSISIPFTINSSNYYRGGISLGNCNGLILLAGYAIVGTLDQSATSIDFYFNVSAAAAQRMTIASMNSSGAVQFTATYMV